MFSVCLLSACCLNSDERERVCHVLFFHFWVELDVKRTNLTFAKPGKFWNMPKNRFEAGKVFDAVPPLLQAVEQLVELHKDETVEYTDQQQKRIREFHQRLEKILPESSQPEVDLPTPESY